jgi:hypothetical protein
MTQHLILSSKLLYNIGIDAGDNITNILFNKNIIIPSSNSISFILPELDEEYIIKLIIGDYILAEHNTILDIINIKSDEKKIFIDIKLDNYYIIININTKIKSIYKNIIKYNNININTNINNNINILDEGYIDINYYKLKFEINQIIKIIRKKINMNYIILNDEEKNILNNKFINLLNNIDINNITTQKMLDIKNTLKTKFFID